MDKDNAIVVFQGNKIRKAWFNDEWWFVIEDIIFVLTDSKDPKGYIKDMRRRDEELSKGWGQIATPLPIETAGGRQNMNCVNTEGGFRIAQSIPSPKAEPFKLWLAKVGYERIKEIENPELAQERMKKLYELKGYPKNWIEKRLRGIAIRQELTDEWKTRGVDEHREYAILTDEISKATFGIGVKQHNEIKGLAPQRKNQNLRDHMDDLELIFTMLGEKATSEITQAKDSQGYDECLDSSKEGGSIAGNARKSLEAKTGKKVISNKNYLHLNRKSI